jgi:hypothetical protein
MATYESLMDAARKAHAAGEADHARRLVQMAQNMQGGGDMKARIDAAKTGTLEADPRNLAAAQSADDIATARMGLPSTPEAEAFNIVEQHPMAGYRAVRDKSMPFVGEWTDELAGMTTFGADRDHAQQRNQAVVQQYQEQHPGWAKVAQAQGIAEGALASIGAPAARGAGFVANVAGKLPSWARAGIAGAGAGATEAASSAAGAAGEGERLDAAKQAAPTGALIGAAAGAGLDLAVKGLSSGVQRLINRSVEKPTVQTLRAAKSAAYRAVDNAGDRFTQQEVQGAVSNFQSVLDDADFVPGVGSKVDNWLLRLGRMAERPEGVTLSRLDDIRSNIFKAYRAAPDEVELLDAISVIDDLIESKASTSDLLRVARDANSRYMKAELFDAAFDKATRQTAGSGSGGNIFNKYIQAVNSIIDNPKKARWFTPDEMQAMREFVEINPSQEFLRRIGKLSPNGNGLMQALNVAAAAADPKFLALSAASTAAKNTADRGMQRNADDLYMLMATGQRTGRYAPGSPWKQPQSGQGGAMAGATATNALANY